MKIGVMTWWRNTNYGGFLQGLALQTFLQNRGYDVEMVKYAFPFGDLSPTSVIWPSRIRSVRGFLSPHLSLRLGADAREWVQDISTAEFVLSDSFHALMFATIFGREIRVEFPDTFRSAMSARITDFQSRAGELDAWCARSKKWLLDAIG